MKITIDELRSLPHQRLTIAFKESIDDLNAVKPVLGDITVTANSTGIRLQGNVQTLLKLTCHRCLRPYFQSINIPLEENFPELQMAADLQQPLAKEHELTAEDFIEYLSEDGTLDITDFVYQAVTLATPVSYDCGADCPGPAFPSTEGESGSLSKDKEARLTPDRIDPRWENLKSLFPKKDTDIKS